MNTQGFAQFIPLILIFIIFYFFLIRPQQKRVKDHRLMVQNLKRGDEVITSGGIIGIVDKVHEDDKRHFYKTVYLHDTLMYKLKERGVNEK